MIILFSSSENHSAFDKDEVLGIPSETTLYDLVTTGCLKDGYFFRVPMTLKLCPECVDEPNGDKIIVEKMSNPEMYYSHYTLGFFFFLFKIYFVYY